MKIHGYAAITRGQQLTPFSYDLPQLQPFELLLKVSHCGVCHTDLHMIENHWGRSTYPLLPGHEIVGRVAQAGPEAQVGIGERVGVSWVHSACLSCPQCLEGQTNICPTKQGIYNKGR